MLCSHQFPVFALMFWIQTSQTTPLFQGFSVQRKFEVKLQPFEFKPLSIFKEKWSPFGRFGIRKGIQKRDLGTSTGEENSPIHLSPAPVFEVVDEGSSNNERVRNVALSALAFRPGTEQLKPITSNLIKVPESESFQPFTGLYTSIAGNQKNSAEGNQGQPIIREVFGELPPRTIVQVSELPATGAAYLGQTISPIISQPGRPLPILPSSPTPVPSAVPIPIQSVTPIPVQPINQITVQRPNWLPVPSLGSTVRPVSQIPVQYFGLIPGQLPPMSQGVVPLLTSPPPVRSNVPLSEIPPTEGPFVRGSRMALYFGNMFLQLVTQVLSNARLQISQLKASSSSPPPPVSTNK